MQSCVNILNDPHVVNKVTNMLANLIKSNEVEEHIFVSLHKRNA